jgi:hypothetical protein
VLGILLVAVVAAGAFALTRPVARVSPASAGPPITADGYSRFTPNGYEYFTDHGEVFIAIDHDATELALPAAGASTFALVPPLTVKVLEGNGSTRLVKDVARVLVFTEQDRVVTIKLTTAADELVEFRSDGD